MANLVVADHRPRDRGRAVALKIVCAEARELPTCDGANPYNEDMQMRASIVILLVSSLTACGKQRCYDCEGTMRPPAIAHARDAGVAEHPLVEDFALDVLLDIDQPREQKPGGSWTEQVYVGPKQYDRLFVDIKHDAPSTYTGPPKGPLGDIDHLELVADGKQVLATFPRTGFQYKAEPFSEFVDDRGGVEGTREHLKVFLGPAVGTYVKSTHPYHFALRGRTAAGALVIEKVFDGDEAGEYPTIVPPRPY